MEDEWYRYIDTKHESPLILLIGIAREMTVQMPLQQDRFNQQESPIPRNHRLVLARLVQPTREACKYELWEHNGNGWTAGIVRLAKKLCVTIGTVRSFESTAAIIRTIRVEQARLQRRRDGERLARNTIVSDPTILPSQKAPGIVTKEQPLLVKALDPK